MKQAVHHIGKALGTQNHMRFLLSGPFLLALVPAISLLAFWVGGEVALLVVALGAPLSIAAFAPVPLSFGLSPRTMPSDKLTGLAQRDTVERALDTFLVGGGDRIGTTAALAIEIDDFNALATRLGDAATEDVLRTIGARIRSVLRERDVVGRIQGPTFAIAMSPALRLDLETLVQMSARLQSSIAQPVSVNRTAIYITASVGFCLSARASGNGGAGLLAAAEAALDAAKATGAGGLRAYSEKMQRVAPDRPDTIEDVAVALETGEIKPWFQPQLSTDTGEVTGFECLARWEHPERGPLAPDAFLPQVEHGGLQDRLNEVIVYQGLVALRAWRRAGFKVPSIAVNFSAAELRNPSIVDRIKWELDRFDIPAADMTVEILETVIATDPDDVAVRNVASLSTLGCKIDLDDFGTGQSALTQIRRFAVDRIKLDRSFVSKVDTDPDQQKMVAALISMSEQLGLDTLAEGVETVGEHAILAQYGCSHVQGYAIARPMPFQDTLGWLDKHRAKLAEAQGIDKKRALR